MERNPEELNERPNRLKAWLSRHAIAVAAGALLALTLALTVGAPFLKRPRERLDPQEQIGLTWIKPAGIEAAYVGNEACRSCHSREYQRVIASPHSHTVRAIPPGEELPEFGSAQTVSDDVNNILYSVRKGEGKNQLVAVTGTKTDMSTARWVFGSGTQAWTYLAETGPRFGQLRITYYPPSKAWNFTPGSGPGTPLRHPLGDPYTSAQAAACFGCHSTVLIGTRKDLDFAHSRLNVGCESCHGPCRSHIESVTGIAGTSGGAPRSQAGIVKPPSHGGPQIMRLCGSCHRVPNAASDASGAGAGELARFPGEALPRSRCFIASAGKLSCTTCHDPHQSTRKQQESSFEGKCLNCHTAPHGTACARGMTSGCVGCHMPEESIARRLPLKFHNHWIRKDPSGG